MQDVTAGWCKQEVNAAIKAGDFSVKMTPQEHQDFTQCGFKSVDGFELGKQLECSVRLQYTLKLCISVSGPMHGSHALMHAPWSCMHMGKTSDYQPKPVCSQTRRLQT